MGSILVGSFIPQAPVRRAWHFPGTVLEGANEGLWEVLGLLTRRLDVLPYLGCDR